MISDVLSDAIAAIRRYQRELPWIYDGMRPQIDATVAVLERLRGSLDAPPLPEAERQARWDIGEVDRRQEEIDELSGYCSQHQRPFGPNGCPECIRTGEALDAWRAKERAKRFNR